MIGFLSSVNWLGMIIGVVTAYLLGVFWYGPKLFGKQFLAENNYGDNYCPPKSGMVLSFAYLLVTGLFFAFLQKSVLTGHAFYILVVLYCLAVMLGMGLGSVMNRYFTTALYKIHVGYDVLSVVIIVLSLELLFA